MKAPLLISATLVAPLFFVHVARADQPAVIVVQSDPPASAPMPQPTPANQTPPPPAEYQRTTHGTPGAYSDPDDDESDGPRARKGFQIALRTGYALPMGSSASGSKMSQDFGGQVPFLIDVGGKIHPNIFIGGTLGLNIGGCGDLVANDCASVGLRIGAEIIFSILPRNRVNPWVGYGIGLEASGASANNGSESLSLFGPEFGHFMGGVDFRINRIFGVGPFVDYGVGEYTSASVTQNGISESESLSGAKAIHEWLTLGVKFTFFP